MRIDLTKMAAICGDYITLDALVEQARIGTLSSLGVFHVLRLKYLILRATSPNLQPPLASLCHVLLFCQPFASHTALRYASDSNHWHPGGRIRREKKDRVSPKRKVR